jgi:hypothetical protein
MAVRRSGVSWLQFWLRMFDRGVLGIGDGHRILVSQRFVGQSLAAREQVTALADRPLLGPQPGTRPVAPPHRSEFARGDSPTGPDDFDDWVVRTVLNPETPLFREARYLLAEEPDLRDTALYLSVLAAVANGNATRSGMAGYLERKATDIAHPINVLEDAGLLHRDADAFRDNRPTYRIAEPLIGFYHAIMRPVWDQLERPGSASRVWQGSSSRFASNVLGPHFEQICREWALPYADPALLGGLPARVGHGVVHDARARTGHEVDVAVIGIADGARPPLLAIGEAKWNGTIGIAHIERLQHIRDLIAQARRYDTTHTRFICFSGAGFNAKARAAADASPGIQLIDLPTLYGQVRPGR